MPILTREKSEYLVNRGPFQNKFKSTIAFNILKAVWYNTLIYGLY